MLNVAKADLTDIHLNSFLVRMSSANLTDQEIQELWLNPLFSGAFTGIRNFSLLLKTDLGYNVPESRLRRILNREPTFVIHQRRPRRFQRRKFYLSALGRPLL